MNPRAKPRDACHTIPASWHDDDCAGCERFIECARVQDGFNAECWCPYCYWYGYWDDCEVKVIRETRMDPEERYSLCPLCGKEVEDVND
jgi:hypothetical protein